jgi:hypothetical protein
MPIDEIKPNKRTLTQNASLHKYLTMVAHELETMGFTMQDVVEKVSLAEIYPTLESVKEVIWRPIQKAQLGKTSSTTLTTAEINKVYEPMAQFLAQNFQISLPFPSQENTEEYLQSYEK